LILLAPGPLFRGLSGPSVNVLTPSIVEVKNEWNYTSNHLHIPSGLEKGKLFRI